MKILQLTFHLNLNFYYLNSRHNSWKQIMFTPQYAAASTIFATRSKIASRCSFNGSVVGRTMWFWISPTRTILNTHKAIFVNNMFIKSVVINYRTYTYFIHYLGVRNCSLNIVPNLYACISKSCLSASFCASSGMSRVLFTTNIFYRLVINILLFDKLHRSCTLVKQLCVDSYKVITVSYTFLHPNPPSKEPNKLSINNC
jgi:hypothetical protein